MSTRLRWCTVAVAIGFATAGYGADKPATATAGNAYDALPAELRPGGKIIPGQALNPATGSGKPPLVSGPYGKLPLKPKAGQYDAPPKHKAVANQYDAPPKRAAKASIYDAPPARKNAGSIYDSPPNRKAAGSIYDAPPKRKGAASIYDAPLKKVTSGSSGVSKPKPKPATKPKPTPRRRR